METGLIKFPGRSLARERKKIHESSEHIYPKYATNDVLNIARQQNISSFETTSYSIDFARKEGKPALPRPCSVTRRNRPHPSEVRNLIRVEFYFLNLQNYLVLNTRSVFFCFNDPISFRDVANKNRAMFAQRIGKSVTFRNVSEM